MKQTIFSVAGFDRYAKTTKRAAFLAEIDHVVPWAALCGLVEPVPDETTICRLRHQSLTE